MSSSRHLCGAFIAFLSLSLTHKRSKFTQLLFAVPVLYRMYSVSLQICSAHVGCPILSIVFSSVFKSKDIFLCCILVFGALFQSHWMYWCQVEDALNDSERQ